MDIEAKRKKKRDYMRRYYAETDYVLYVAHRHMMDRCYNQKALDFHNYGGRGIVVCDEWKFDSKAFISWAKSSGWKRGLQIDRIEVNGPYSPANCRWVTSRQNNRNRRNNKLDVEKVNQIRHMLAEGFTGTFIAKQFGVHHSLIYRIKLHQQWL